MGDRDFVDQETKKRERIEDEVATSRGLQSQKRVIFSSFFYSFLSFLFLLNSQIKFK